MCEIRNDRLRPCGGHALPPVMKTMSAPSRHLEMAARLSSADFLPMSGLEPAPMPPVSFSPIWQLVIALGLIEILTIRVHNDEFDSADAAGDHPVDNVVAGRRRHRSL